MSDDKHLWSQFCKLGEMIGDGLHHEEPWISREYKRLSRILIPEVRERERKQRQLRNKIVDDQISEKLKTNHCDCGGKLKQSRSGSSVVVCVECGVRYKFKKRKGKK